VLCKSNLESLRLCLFQWKMISREMCFPLFGCNLENNFLTFGCIEILDGGGWREESGGDVGRDVAMVGD
jgi:hypothetical protein